MAPRACIFFDAVPSGALGQNLPDCSNPGKNFRVDKPKRPAFARAKVESLYDKRTYARSSCFATREKHHSAPTIDTVSNSMRAIPHLIYFTWLSSIGAYVFRVQRFARVGIIAQFGYPLRYTWGS